jgi:hypothetical protein
LIKTPNSVPEELFMSDTFLDDFAQFEADLFAGKFDHMVGKITTKKPKKQSKEVKQLLAKPAEPAHKVTFPTAVAFVSQELEVTCVCGHISVFLTKERQVKMSYEKTGRSFLMDADKETSHLQLPEEKMTSQLKVYSCNCCSKGF